MKHYLGIGVGLAIAFILASLITGELQWIAFIAAAVGFTLYELIRRSRTTKSESVAIESDERVKYNTMRFHAITLFLSVFILFLGLVVLNYGFNKTHVSIVYIIIYSIITFAVLIVGTTFFKKR